MMMADDIDKLGLGLAADHQAEKRGRRKATEAAPPVADADLNPGEDDKADVAGALDGLGKAIEQRDGALDQGGANGTSGDGGEHHAAHERSIEDMQAAIDAFEPDTTKLVFDGRNLFLTLLKQQNEVWFKKSKGEQQDIAMQIENAVDNLVSRTVELVRAAGAPAIRALMEGYTDKGEIKATLKIKPFDDAEAEAAVLGLHRAAGKHVLIIVASGNDFKQGESPVEVEGNEPTMDFDAGRDPD